MKSQFLRFDTNKVYFPKICSNKQDVYIQFVYLFFIFDEQLNLKKVTQILF